jgi:hypothetical protein
VYEAYLANSRQASNKITDLSFASEPSLPSVLLNGQLAQLFDGFNQFESDMFNTIYRRPQKWSSRGRVRGVETKRRCGSSCRIGIGCSYPVRQVVSSGRVEKNLHQLFKGSVTHLIQPRHLSSTGTDLVSPLSQFAYICKQLLN